MQLSVCLPAPAGFPRNTAFAKPAALAELAVFCAYAACFPLIAIRFAFEFRAGMFDSVLAFAICAHAAYWSAYCLWALQEQTPPRLRELFLPMASTFACYALWAAACARAYPDASAIPALAQKLALIAGAPLYPASWLGAKIASRRLAFESSCASRPQKAFWRLFCIELNGKLHPADPARFIAGPEIGLLVAQGADPLLPMGAARQSPLHALVAAGNEQAALEILLACRGRRSLSDEETQTLLAAWAGAPAACPGLLRELCRSAPPFLGSHGPLAAALCIQEHYLRTRSRQEPDPRADQACLEKIRLLLDAGARLGDGMAELIRSIRSISGVFDGGYTLARHMDMRLPGIRAEFERRSLDAGLCPQTPAGSRPCAL